MLLSHVDQLNKFCLMGDEEEIRALRRRSRRKTSRNKSQLDSVNQVSQMKIVHYGRGEPITQRTHDLEEEFREFVDQHEDRSPERRRSRSRSMGRSAPSNKKPPVIRIRRDQSLNGNVWGSPQQPASTTSDSTVSPMMDPPSSSIQHDDIILPSAAAQAQQQQQQQTQTPRKARKRSMKRKPPTTGSSELINVTNPPSSLVRSLSRSDLLSRDEGQARSHLQLASDVRRSKSHEQLMERERRGSHESLATTTTTSTSNANAGRGHHNHHVTHHHHHHHQLPDYAEEAKKFVRTAMIEASNKPVDKQIIRIINGYSPSIQSQVLLNTKTTQPWEELVRDLGMAVKLPKSRATTMETISGRKIQSYSQLRTELLAGNLAFYIYPERDISNEFGLPPLSRNVNARMPERSLGKAEAKGTKGNKNENKKLPPLVNQSQSGSNGSSKNLNNMDRYQVGGHHKSYEALHDTETKYRRSKQQQQHERQNRYGSVTQLDVNDNGGMDGGHRANSRSNPALRSRSPYPEQTSTGVQTTLDVPQKKRETRRRRSEASVYLASASRSRSRSISPN